ncbi:MAG: HD domain-containing protein [Leptolyngbyaceae cyanobacterium SL_1_1]|nr:HD domain-containing protein [Leptolyngbyaceae cyanobacterium RM1_1_2]NJO10587.1 HD domain-containing protein [Leptolyngbyaceae cyanobacterium SL_1_1]
MDNPLLNQRLQFILELDQLKQVQRQTLLLDSSRRENSAEHSWHLAMMAIALAEYAPPQSDLFRAIQQVLIHDVVEIDAGDTFCYDLAAQSEKASREAKAATRIFGLLPAPQADELRSLWEEFEAGTTPTAQFAAALDRLQPFLHNQQTQGGTWKQHGITRTQVMQRMAAVKTGTPDLWNWLLQVVDDCVAAGWIRP